MRSAISPNDPRFAALVAALDEEEVPAAETWRRVSAVAEAIDLSRPSYQHVRRLVRLERRRKELRAEARKVLSGAVATSAGLAPSVVLVLERLRELQLPEELVLQKHKAVARRW